MMIEVVLPLGRDVADSAVVGLVGQATTFRDQHGAPYPATIVAAGRNDDGLVTVQLDVPGLRQIST